MGAGRTPQVVLRTGDGDVAAQVRRLTGLAGVGLDVVAPGTVLPAAAVTLDHEADLGAVLRVAVAADRAGVVPGEVPERLTLPEQAGALLDVAVAAGTPVRARTVGVVGAHGGAGASVLAAALARATVGVGVATALVDLDPAGGGLDVLLGLEHDPGQRWADVLSERGALLPERLATALPAWQLVRVLSADGRGGVAGEDVRARAAVRALAQGHDVVVLDLPRDVLAGGATARLWLPWCADVVLVCGGGLRGAAAARAGTARLQGHRSHLVVRGRVGEPDDVALAAGTDVVVGMRDQRGLDGDIEHGGSPGDRRRGALGTAARALVDRLGLP